MKEQENTDLHRVDEQYEVYMKGAKVSVKILFWLRTDYHMPWSADISHYSKNYSMPPERYYTKEDLIQALEMHLKFLSMEETLLKYEQE